MTQNVERVMLWGRESSISKGRLVIAKLGVRRKEGRRGRGGYVGVVEGPCLLSTEPALPMLPQHFGDCLASVISINVGEGRNWAVRLGLSNSKSEDEDVVHPGRMDGARQQGGWRRVSCEQGFCASEGDWIHGTTLFK